MAMRPRLSLVCLASVVVLFEALDARGSQQAESPPLDTRNEIRVTLIAEGSSRPHSQVLLEARQQATMIYDAIGVSLAWTDERGIDDGAAPASLVAVVLSDPRTEEFLRGKDVPPSVLGVAPYQTGRIYVFWDRIARRAWENDVLPQIVLARVLAHEIGHHLLPLQGHSDSGIMRPSVNYRSSAPPAFTHAEAEAIRTLLSETDDSQSGAQAE
jgi:hypothetical protein